MTRDAWTPYGLERIRIERLRRKRIIALLIGLLIGFAWLAMWTTTISTEQNILVNGRKGDGIQIAVPEEEKRDGPVSVSLSPGRVTRADTAQAETQTGVQRPTAPTFTGANPYNWNYYLAYYGPWILILFALRALFARRSKDEVNFGIYKGAMPLEMITAAASTRVLTTREARSSIFGKARGDYLPADRLRVERMEEDA